MIHYALRFSAVRKFMNAKMNTIMDNALQFSNEKHVELQEKSSKLLASVRSNRITENIFTQYKIFELSFLFVLLLSIYKFFIAV